MDTEGDGQSHGNSGTTRDVLPGCGRQRFLSPSRPHGMPFFVEPIKSFCMLIWSFQAEHKIQSVKGNLVLEMDQVPKVLRPLVQEWLPEAYIVSFKVSRKLISVRVIDRPLKQCHLAPCLARNGASAAHTKSTKSPDSIRPPSSRCQRVA